MSEKQFLIVFSHQETLSRSFASSSLFSYEISLRNPWDIPDFWTLDAECLRLAVDAFAGGALVVDDVVERAGAIEQGSHQPAFLPIGIFDTASACVELGMLTDLTCALRKEQGAAKALCPVAVGMLELVGGAITEFKKY